MTEQQQTSFINYSQDVIKISKDLKKAQANLKKLQREFKLYGTDVTAEEVERQRKLVEFYQNALNQLTEESSRSEEEALKARIESKQKELDDLTSRKKPEELTGPEKVGAIRGGKIVQPSKEKVENLETEIKDLNQKYNTLVESKIPDTTTSANITDKAQTPMGDLLGGGRQKARIVFDLPENSIIERNTNGTFSVNNIDSIFVYDRSNNTIRAQDVESFYNNLYTLRPDAITEYKKGLGYEAKDINGVLTEKFKEDFFDAAKAVSEYSYGYGLSGVKQPIDIVQYLITPNAYPEITSIIGQQKSGGTGTGVTIDANKLAANVDTIKLLEVELGASLTKQQRDKIARDLATGRVNTTTLPSTIAKAGNIELEEGQGATLKAALKQSAADNGVFFEETWYDNTAKNILQGKLTQETANAEIIKQAKFKYGAPSILAGLDAGFSVRDQASQYTNWLAQVRGVDASNISLDDPILSKAFMNRNNEGMPVQMDMSSWQNWAKENDPTYATSNMAEESYMPALRAFGQFFGKSI